MIYISPRHNPWRQKAWMIKTVKEKHEYWVTQKLPQICIVILRIYIGKVAWFAVYICGNLWVTKYVIIDTLLNKIRNPKNKFTDVLNRVFIDMLNCESKHFGQIQI